MTHSPDQHFLFCKCPGCTELNRLADQAARRRNAEAERTEPRRPGEPITQYLSRTQGFRPVVRTLEPML